MVTLIKILIGLIVTLTANTIDSCNSIGVTKQSITQHSSMVLDKSCQENTYMIIESKCNTCYYRRNNRRIFTKENMNTWANDIYKQVFTKKRMPKRKKTKLNQNEHQELLTWILISKNSQNGNQL
ncbi:hypothetical protein KH5_12570 [Urechidicola sp. KH5]